MRWRQDDDYDGPVGDSDSTFSPQAWDLIVGTEQCSAHVLHMLGDNDVNGFMAYVTKSAPDGSSSGVFGNLHMGVDDSAYAAAEAEARLLYAAHCKKR